jgi:hypothetical protein
VTSFRRGKLLEFSRFLTALPTPFQDDEISEEAFGDLIAWQINQGCQGLVVGGATGEAATLSDEEHLRLIRIAVETVDGRLPVVAATGTNCTRHSIALTQAAEAAGATAALIVTPYYNKPTQDGLYRHYREIARSVGLPIIVENDPSSTCVDAVGFRSVVWRRPDLQFVSHGGRARFCFNRRKCCSGALGEYPASLYRARLEPRCVYSNSIASIIASASSGAEPGPGQIRAFAFAPQFQSECQAAARPGKPRDGPRNCFGSYRTEVGWVGPSIQPSRR